MANIKQIELNGFKLDVDMDGFDDVEFFEKSDKLEEHPNYIIDMVKMGIGEKQYEKMKAYFVKKEGRFKMSVLTEAFNLIMDITDPKDEASGQSASSTQTK